MEDVRLFQEESERLEELLLQDSTCRARKCFLWEGDTIRSNLPKGVGSSYNVKAERSIIISILNKRKSERNCVQTRHRSPNEGREVKNQGRRIICSFHQGLLTYCRKGKIARGIGEAGVITVRHDSQMRRQRL